MVDAANHAPDRTRGVPGWLRFEFVIVAIGLGYVALRLSPSSYSLGLYQLGAYSPPVVGSPRLIRYDEWAVLTPQFQAAVNNDFRVVNETSFYGETLLGTSGLPIRNWGLIFKPQVWAFFVASPAIAYSIYWATQFVAFLCGWSVLLRKLGFKATTAAITASVLFLSPFVQAWWSGFGFQLALFPWVVWLVLAVRSHVALAAILALVVPVWFIGQFYVPGIPPLVLLGLGLLLAFRPATLTLRRCAAIAAGGAAGGAITLAYFHPVFRAFSDSVYPGSRWTLGGALPAWQSASQLFPGITSEGYREVVGENICVIAVVSSWLPLAAICVVRWGAAFSGAGGKIWRSNELRPIVVMTGLALGFAVWQLTILGAPMSYVFGLGFSTEQRVLFAAGAPLVIAAAWALQRLPIEVSVVRVAAFAMTVVAAWAIASIQLFESSFVLRDELIVVLPFAGIGVVAAAKRLRGTSWRWRVAVMLAASVPSLQWLLFNPVQSTTVIFERPVSTVTRSLDQLAARRPDGAIAPRIIFSGAILNGAGYRSVTHTIATPSPNLFRRWFPDLPERYFRNEFNRYIQLQTADVDSPELRGLDLVLLPANVIARHASVPDRGRDVPWDRIPALREKHRRD